MKNPLVDKYGILHTILGAIITFYCKGEYMTKKIVRMLIIVFIITSNVAAMLVKFPKFSMLKTLQQRHFCVNEKIDKKKVDNLQFDRGYQFLEAIQRNDVELADLLFKNFKFNVHSDWIKNVKSLDQIRLLEKYGCNIHHIDDGCGGNYLHYAIGFIDDFYSRSADDSFIEYAIARGIDPHAIDASNRNLWHKLFRSPHGYHYQFYESLFLRRSKLLHSLSVDPHHKDDLGCSAIKNMQDKISYLKKQHKHAWCFSEQEKTIFELKACRKLLKMMDRECFNKKNNRE